MVRYTIPKGKAQRAFIGVIASVVALTFGIAAKGVYDAATDPIGQTSPASAGQISAGKAGAVAGNAAGAAVPGASPASGQGGQTIIPVMPGQFAVKRVLKIEGPMEHGSFVWDEEGVPKNGQVIVTVDLKAQTMSVFRGGYEIGAAVILYGADNKETPLGIFPISQKKVDHVSNLYDAPMPYMQRLTDDGVAIHASEVEWGNATHGCIGIPLEFAKKLYGATKLGDIVIITDGHMMNMGQG